MTKRIFVIGHSGAGKGVLAQAIAKELGWKFINADVFGCAGHIGRRISEVVGEEGEEKLNHCLSEVLSHQLRQENVVVTTDENIICDETARVILKSEFTVYVKVSVPVQVERLSNYRPLLPVDDFPAFLQKLQDERNDLFEQVASMTMSSDEGDENQHAKEVINQL